MNPKSRSQDELKSSIQKPDMEKEATRFWFSLTLMIVLMMINIVLSPVLAMQEDWTTLWHLWSSLVVSMIWETFLLSNFLKAHS